MSRLTPTKSYLVRAISLVTLLLSVHRVDAAEFFCSAGNVTCLIASINEANTRGGVNTINLEPGSYALTSVDNVQQFGANGLPLIGSELTINGVDAAMTIIERDSGAPPFRIFQIAENGSLSVNELTLRGGTLNPGGAILNDGTLTVSYSIIEGNQAQRGGAIFSRGSLSLAQTILARNSSMEGSGIENTGTAVLTSVSLVDNFATGAAGVSNFGTMTIQNSTINDNVADGGGGILNRGMMEIKNTTVSDNRVRFFGGAGALNFGTLKISNSTITNNSSGGLGGNPVGSGAGVSNIAPGVVELQNTIVALNRIISSTNPNAGPDCAGPITSLGNNIIGDLTGCDINLTAGDIVTDAGLGGFVDDGTPGGGHFSLLANSPAIDRGNDTACSADPVLNTDQLGQTRAGPCDIGAIEFEGALTIVIDVRPWRDPNRINLKSNKQVNVALLSGAGFDATLLDTSTVRFGATGFEAAPVHISRRDINGDGQRDLVLRFRIQDLGLQCGASDLKLTGLNPNGHPISGSSPILTTGCKQNEVAQS